MKKILIVEDESLVAHHLKLILVEAGYKVCGIADSVNEAISAIEEQNPDLVLLDIHLKGELNGIDLAKKLTERDIAFVYLTANFQGRLLQEAKTTMPFGFIVKPFREDDLITTLDVAFYRYQNSIKSRRMQEMDLDEKFKGIKNYTGDIKEKMLKSAHILQPHITFDYLNFIVKKVNEPVCNSIGFLRIGFDEYQVIGEEEFLNITSMNQKKLAEIYASLPRPNKSKFFNAEDFDCMCDQNPLSKIIADNYDFESAIFFPALSNNSGLIRYEFYNRKGNSYSQHHIALLSHLHVALSSILETQQVATDFNYAKTLNVSNLHPVGVQEPPRSFEGIIGQSRAMLSVLDHIATVSPLDISVLILGESGTGKEKIAKSIHSLSKRKNKPLVIVNCASLPGSLIESELFGHEKGAFTGANERRIGKFELADSGTIFLDEIGEMAVDLQTKLLRVLQEQEIERVGGKGPIKIDVRIIAATNRDLELEMEEGRFRLDLYYRLFVFPIMIPSLRERTDDIPALAGYFVSHYAKKYNKSIKGISPEVLSKMTMYPWPGNVRELEHFIERSILLTKGSIINEAILPKKSPKTESAQSPGAERIKTIGENERDYIISVLAKCNGRIRGAGGAAEVMALPPTTLHSRMKKLGIK